MRPVIMTFAKEDDIKRMAIHPNAIRKIDEDQKGKVEVTDEKGETYYPEESFDDLMARWMEGLRT
jgi:hypothetical protein